MSLSPARQAGSASVAVVGAESPDGTRVREALAALGVPGSRVDLYGATGGEVVLSEYDGEARLIQEPEPEEVAEHGVVFVCESGEASARAVASVGDGSLVLDLGESVQQAGRVPLVHLDINPDAARTHRGVIRVPHPLSVVLAEILLPLQRAFGIRRVSAVVLRPVVDFGDRGLEELKDQTVGLLRFSDAPHEVFGRQLAFNLIPQASLRRAAEGALEQRVADELASLLAWAEPRAALALVTVPVFHGHAASVHLELVSSASLAGVRSAWDAPDALARAGSMTTPIETAGERVTIVSGVREDGLGGYWLWAVAGEAGSAPAIQAVRLARMLGGL